jgi:hypothetical protein
MRRVALLVTFAALSATRCSPDYPNPFEDGGQSRSVPPPAGSALIFASDAWATTPGRGREIMAIAADGSGLTRLTFCDDGQRPCDSSEAAFATDGIRAAMLRSFDTNADGVADSNDDTSLVFVDLVQQAEAELVPAASQVSGVDWSRQADLLVYSSQGTGGEDLFRTDVRRPTDDNQQNTQNLTCGAPSCDTSLSERRGRIDETGSVAAYERTAGARPSEIWIFQTATVQFQVTTAPAEGALLAGTPYRVGGDADPDFSPDNRNVVFRHLVSSAGRGVWEIRRVASDTSTAVTTLVSGEAWRGAPDWDDAGIVFPEADASGTRLVVIQPDGTGRRVLASFPAGVRVDNPRWLR